MGRILYFDGHCNLCNATVDFLIRHDHRARLKFASLQGETAARHLPAELRESVRSVVLTEGKKFWVESAAALNALATLGGLYKLSLIFILVPAVLRDGVYRWVARNRYSWFGRRDICRVPTPAERERLLP